MTMIYIYKKNESGSVYLQNFWAAVSKRMETEGTVTSHRNWRGTVAVLGSDGGTLAGIASTAAKAALQRRNRTVAVGGATEAEV